MTTLLFLGGLGGYELFLLLIYLVILLFFPLIFLIDCLRSEWKDSTNKLIWTIVIIVLPVLGAILYIAIGRSQRG